MPFKRAGWLQRAGRLAICRRYAVSMPFKRAGWLQPEAEAFLVGQIVVSMPFKRFQIYKTPRLRRGVLVPKSCCS